MIYWIEMMIFFHLIFCTISLYELFVESTLQGKFKAACIIISLPLAGILLFEKSRKKGPRPQTDPVTGKPA